MASHNITFDPESGTPYAANLNIYGGAGFDDTFIIFSTASPCSFSCA